MVKDSPWEQECDCNNEHGRCGRVEGHADLENHYIYLILRKKLFLEILIKTCGNPFPHSSSGGNLLSCAIKIHLQKYHDHTVIMY